MLDAGLEVMMDILRITHLWAVQSCNDVHEAKEGIQPTCVSVSRSACQRDDPFSQGLGISVPNIPQKSGYGKAKIMNSSQGHLNIPV